MFIDWTRASCNCNPRLFRWCNPKHRKTGKQNVKKQLMLLLCRVQLHMTAIWGFISMWCYIKKRTTINSPGLWQLALYMCLCLCVVAEGVCVQAGGSVCGGWGVGTVNNLRAWRSRVAAQHHAGISAINGNCITSLKIQLPSFFSLHSQLCLGLGQIGPKIPSPRQGQ